MLTTVNPACMVSFRREKNELAVRKNYRIMPLGWTVQCDHSGRALGLVAIKTRVAFQYIPILKHNFCSDGNNTYGTTWWVILYLYCKDNILSSTFGFGNALCCADELLNRELRQRTAFTLFFIVACSTVICKPVNSNLGGESSLPAYIPLFSWLSALRAVWLVWTQQKQEMSSHNLKLSLQAWSFVNVSVPITGCLSLSLSL